VVVMRTVWGRAYLIWAGRLCRRAVGRRGAENRSLIST
jgi:hypothetical protein